MRTTRSREIDFTPKCADSLLDLRTGTRSRTPMTRKRFSSSARRASGPLMRPIRRRELRTRRPLRHVDLRGASQSRLVDAHDEANRLQKGDEVFGIYPDTTSFYQCVVTIPARRSEHARPRPQGGTCHCQFQDDRAAR